MTVEAVPAVPSRLERLPELRDEPVQCRRRGAGRVLSPQLVDEAVARHDLTGVESEDSQQRALTCTDEHELGPVPSGLDRPQKQDLEGARATRHAQDASTVGDAVLVDRKHR